MIFSKLKQLPFSVKCCVFCVVSDGTPYAGGHFGVKLVLGKSFPAEPPKGFFLTKIFHPNVAKNGEICVNTLKKDWKTDYGVKHILLVSVSNKWAVIILCLMSITQRETVCKGCPHGGGMVQCGQKQTRGRGFSECRRLQCVALYGTE